MVSRVQVRDTAFHLVGKFGSVAEERMQRALIEGQHF